MISSINNRRTQSLLALCICVLIGSAWLFIPHPAVVIGIGLVPVVILFVLAKPFLMALMFVIFSFFRIHEVFPQLDPLKLPLLLSIASLMALIWHVGLTRKIDTYWRPELTAISIFFVVVLIGVFMAGNRPVAISYFTSVYWKIALMTFTIAWLSRTAEDFALSSRIITLSGMTVGLVALFNKFNAIGLVEGTRVTIGRNIGSVLGDPNDLALVLMFPTSFAVSLILTKNIGLYSKLLGLVSVPILFSAVIATQSRGGLLGMLAVFGVYGYRRIQSKILFLTIGILVAIVLFLLAGISDRASGGASELGVDTSSMGRLYAWEAAFGMALHNPFTGVGLDNYYYNYFYYSSHWDGVNHAVHSTWFGVLAETGFLGLCLFISIIVMLIKTAIHALNRVEQYIGQIDPAIHAVSQAVLAGLVGTVVSGTFLTQGFTWPIYILAALVVAIAQWIDKNLPDTMNNQNMGQLK